MSDDRAKVALDRAEQERQQRASQQQQATLAGGQPGALQLPPAGDPNAMAPRQQQGFSPLEAFGMGMTGGDPNAQGLQQTLQAQMKARQAQIAQEQAMAKEQRDRAFDREYQTAQLAMATQNAKSDAQKAWEVDIAAGNIPPNTPLLQYKQAWNPEPARNVTNINSDNKRESELAKVTGGESARRFIDYDYDKFSNDMNFLSNITRAGDHIMKGNNPTGTGLKAARELTKGMGFMNLAQRTISETQDLQAIMDILAFQGTMNVMEGLGSQLSDKDVELAQSHGAVMFQSPETFDAEMKGHFSRLRNDWQRQLSIANRESSGQSDATKKKYQDALTRLDTVEQHFENNIYGKMKQWESAAQTKAEAEAEAELERQAIKELEEASGGS